MNKVILMGRLTRDPEVRYAQNDQTMAIARFSLAVDRRGRRDGSNDQQTADFINCVAFRNQATFAEKYLHKGTKVLATGRIQTGSYTNKDGQRVYTTDVIVEDLEFAESKNANGGFAPAGGGFAPTGDRQPAAPNPDNGSAPDGGFMNIPDGIDEELPFN